jgi:hypothetical protein
VTVLRTIRRNGQPAVIVRVEPLASAADEQSQLLIQVPCWMLDEATCARILTASRPLLNVVTLGKLRELVDRLH